MKKYIGVKMIEAEPMTAGEAVERGFAKFTGKVVPGKGTPGYHVHYPDGYDSWSPADTFEKAYFGIEKTDTITPADVENFQRKVESVKVGTKTTNTTITLLTGYEVHGQSACVNPDNFDVKIGEQYAKPHAEDKIWEGLGFILQWAKYGLKK